MIEIPAAVLAISAFLQKFAFLSIGTNDLIQYTLAVDRSDDTVSHLYDPMHPAVCLKRDSSGHSVAGRSGALIADPAWGG